MPSVIHLFHAKPYWPTFRLLCPWQQQSTLKFTQNLTKFLKPSLYLRKGPSGWPLLYQNGDILKKLMQIFLYDTPI